VKSNYTFLTGTPESGEVVDGRPWPLRPDAPAVPPGAPKADWLTLPLAASSPARTSRLPFAVYRIADTGVVIASLAAALIATNLGEMPRGLEEFLAIRLSLKNILLLAALAIVWRIVGGVLDLYGREGMSSRRTEYDRVVATCSLVAAAGIVFPLTSASGAFSYGSLAVFWAVLSAGMLGMRMLLHAIAEARPLPPRDALIVGTGPRAVEVMRRLGGDRDVAWRIAGFIDSRAFTPPVPTSRGIAGRLEQLPEILLRVPIDEVIVALPVRSQYAAIQDVVGLCESVGVPVTVPTDFFRTHGVSIRPLISSSLLALTVDRPRSRWKLALKRCLDVLGATIGLVSLGPLMLLTASAIKLTSRGPALFAQERYGYGRRIFRMYKFRTMVVGAEAMQPALEHLNEASGPLFKIRRDPRITRIGRLLRRTSIDELPQLFNVLRGEMSLVGPRPMALRDVYQFSEAWLMRRFSVLPGLTGLWQVSGRAQLGYEEWARLDLEYIDQWSLLLDLKLLLRTVPAVLAGTGAD
jgi:exopolysaccharide biosynthesis polyprenyl glycosylphosphotransferase